MTWSLVGTPTTGTAVASGNVTGTEPAGCATDDLLVAWINARGTATFTLPSGWTLIGTQLTGDVAATSGIAGISAYYCIRGASAPGLVWNRTAGDLGQVRVAAFRSNAGGAPSFDLASVAQTAGVVTAAAVSSVAGITPTGNGRLLVLGFSGGDNGTISALSTASIAAGSWTALGASFGTNTGADGAIHGAYHVQTTAAATGNAQGTLSIAGRNALMLAAFKEYVPPPPVASGPIQVKHGGVWKKATSQWAKVSGTWKEAEAYVRHAGVWKPLVDVPAGDPTLALDLDFTAGTLDSKVTLTRSTTATRINASGLVESVAINASRFDHNSVTLAARGLLIEEQRTNVVLQSGNLANATNWPTFSNGSGSVSQTANSGVAPDGTTTAALIAMNRSAGGDYAQLYQDGVILSLATGSGSVWLKAATGGDVGKQIAFTFYGVAYEGLTTVTLTANWVRYTIVANTLTGGKQFILGYYAGSVGTGAVSFLAWGAQAEAGDGATSYIPTTTASVTRAADVAVMTSTNFSSWFNASAGTFVAQFDGPASGTRPIITVDDNTANEVIMLYGSGTDPKVNVTDGGAAQTAPDLDAGTIAAGTAYKFGFSFAANDLAACLNGGTVATDTTSTLPTVTQARLGAGPASNYLNGHLASLKFYNVAKTDAELITLTT